MSRKKSILIASACIVLGMALTGSAAHAAEEVLTAIRSTHQFYLDGERIELEAYLINGNNYVKLADVGEALDFNVYWNGAVRIESTEPYTGRATGSASTPEQARQDIAALVNGVRREHGLAELAMDQRLMDAAQELSGKLLGGVHQPLVHGQLCQAMLPPYPVDQRGDVLPRLLRRGGGSCGAAGIGLGALDPHRPVPVDIEVQGLAYIRQLHIVIAIDKVRLQLDPLPVQVELVGAADRRQDFLRRMRRGPGQGHAQDDTRRGYQDAFLSAHDCAPP